MIRAALVCLLLGIYVAGANDPSFDDARNPIGVLSGSHARNGLRQPRPMRGPTDEELRLALERAIGPGEQIEHVAPAVGCTLVLTDRRLLLVREGANYRPASGVRSWPLDRDLVLRVGRAHRQTNRLVIAHGSDTASVFLSVDQLAEAQRLIGAARRRTFTDDGA